jgi:DNA-binding beta-propeller fold protein YncE
MSARLRGRRPFYTTMDKLLRIGTLLALATQLPAQELLVTSRHTDEVLRYDVATGAFLGVFASGGGLDNPVGLTFGPDGHLYVAGALTQSVLRYDGASGAFLGSFVSVAGLDPRHVNFGPDGHLYVADAATDAVLRFDGASGAPLGAFASGGGLDGPNGFTFGPSGDLYVVSVLTDRVKRYDGRSGAYLGNFASTNMDGPHDVSFGPDGDFYVSNAFTTRIQRFDGETGAFLGTFVLDSRLANPLGLVWDDQGHLLVANQTRNEVLRYHGRTGAFLGVTVSAGAGGLAGPLYAAFRPTSPFTVQPLTPGIAGLRNVATITGATPGARIVFGIGNDRRRRIVPGCSGLFTLSLPATLAFEEFIADESGRAVFASVVPASFQGPYFMRAAEPAACRATDFRLGFFF